MSEPRKLSTYELGVAFEDTIDEYFRSKGYYVIRPAGSKPFDLICLSRFDNLAVEVKYSGTVPKDQLQKQLQLAKQLNLKYIIVTRNHDGSIHIQEIP